MYVVEFELSMGGLAVLGWAKPGHMASPLAQPAFICVLTKFYGVIYHSRDAMECKVGQQKAR